VKVTDSAGNTATATLSLTVNALTSLSITTTNVPSATVGTNYQETFTAQGGSGSYSWSIPSNTQQTALQGVGLNLSLSGSLAGTPAGPGSFPVTLQVKDLATGQTATAPFTIVVNNATLSQCTHDGTGNSILSGHYAFLLTGFDPSGNVFDAVGSFKADGSGNITSGTGDVNSSGYATQGEQNYSFSGTYSIGATDDRGIMTVTNSSTASTGLPATGIYCFAADTVTSGIAYSGRIIEADGSGFMQTGVFEIQNTSDFTASALSTGYAFGVEGVNTGGSALQRAGVIGQLTLNGAGDVTSGQADIANYDSSTSSTTYQAAKALGSSGTYTMGSGGRGTLSVGGGNFVIYQYGSANGFFMLSSSNVNANTLLAGLAIEQAQTTFTTANVQSTGVFREDGAATSNGALVDDVQIGQFGLNGSGGLSYIADENDGGTITAPSGFANANYSVSSLGYLTITNAGNHPASFYLYAPGGGFGLDGSTEVGFWYLAPQTVPNGGFTSSSLSGSYGAGTVTPVAYSTSGAGNSSGNSYPQMFDAAVSFSPGTVSLTQDQVKTPGLAANVSTGQTGSNSYALDSTYGASAGRFILSSGGADGSVGYIVSPTEVMLLNVKPGKATLAIQADHQ
jgi:large repetitive protein